MVYRIIMPLSLLLSAGFSVGMDSDGDCYMEDEYQVIDNTESSTASSTLVTSTSAPKLVIGFIRERKREDIIKCPGIEWDINPWFIRDKEYTSPETTVVCHGFGGDSTLADRLKECGVLTGNLLTYEMVDSRKFNVPLSKANFGQENDTKALAAAFVFLQEYYPGKNTERLNIYGISRGGAAVTNFLDQLVHYQKHAQHLQSVGMSEDIAKIIIGKLKKGVIILDRPLHSVSNVIRNKCEEISNATSRYVSSSFTLSSVPWFISAPLGFIGSIFAASSRKSVATSVDYSVLPIVTRGNYLPWGPNPIESAAGIKDQNFRILVHIQNPDDVLGNDAGVAQFCTALRGPNTHFVVGTGLGHNGMGDTLKQAIAQFKYHYAMVDNQGIIEGEFCSEEKRDGYMKYLAQRYIQQTQPDDQALTKMVTNKQ